MYVPESDTEALEICRLPLGNTVKTPPGREKDVSANIIKNCLFVHRQRLSHLRLGC